MEFRKNVDRLSFFVYVWLLVGLAFQARASCYVIGISMCSTATTLLLCFLSSFCSYSYPSFWFVLQLCMVDA